jgi:hypothetical protein
MGKADEELRVAEQTGGSYTTGRMGARTRNKQANGKLYFNI